MGQRRRVVRPSLVATTLVAAWPRSHHFFASLSAARWALGPRVHMLHDHWVPAPSMTADATTTNPLEARMAVLHVVATLALALMSATALGAVTSAVVDIPTRGTSQRFLYLRPDAPIANVVIWPGGDGILDIQTDGRMTALLASCNPPVRNRQALADHGYAVAVVDVPTDRRAFNPADLIEVVRYLQSRNNVPTWIVGGSTSTASTLDVAVTLALGNPAGFVFYSPEAFSAARAASVNGPSLVIYHPLDTRQEGKLLYDSLTSAPAKREVILTGGNNSGCAGYHTLNGLDAPFVSALFAFIDQYSASIGAAATTPAIEFYHAQLDHYFVTAIAGEVTALDAQTPPGWARTGASFRVWPNLGGAPTGASPVCRVYIPPSDGNSHFYSASPAECDAVRTRFPHFVFESGEVMAVRLPDPATGACAPDTIPVYRLWNNRADVNHRYTTDLTVRQTMIARGHVPEGYGPLGVALCAPL